MPLSKVVVYYIENHYSLHQGETIIETDEISANTVRFLNSYQNNNL